jgi:hypothetical protein
MATIISGTFWFVDFTCGKIQTKSFMVLPCGPVCSRSSISESASGNVEWRFKSKGKIKSPEREIQKDVMNVETFMSMLVIEASITTTVGSSKRKIKRNLGSF